MRGARHILCWLALVCILTVFSAPALALDPVLDVSQYAHTAWKIRDGFTNSAITSLAQTTDGYLWIGTGTGLMRFDGVRNRPWSPPAGTSFPDNRIRTLFASRDGTLWIGTWGGLASWNGREFRTYKQLNGSYVNAVIQDHEGTVWVGGTTPTAGLLCAIRNAGTDCTGEDGSFGASVLCLYEDHKGALWAGTSNGLWRWKPEQQRYSLPARTLGLECVSETAAGAILVGTQTGIWQLADGKFEPFLAPQSLSLTSLLRDRDGGIWIGTQNDGLLHVHGGRTDGFGRLDGLSSQHAERLFEDREGNIWVAAFDGGLDRFRALPAITYAAEQGLSGIALSVLADRQGSMWFSTTTGLYRFRDGHLFAYRPRSERSLTAAPTAPTRSPAVSEVAIEALPDARAASLFEDSHGRIWFGFLSGLGYLENGRFVSLSGVPGGFIDSIAEDKQGNLWIAHRDAGLLRVSNDLNVQHVTWPSTGKAADWWRISVDPADGGLWIGSFVGGVVHLVDGAVRAAYSADDGLGKGTVNDIRVAPDGTVWVAANGGLSRIKSGRIATLNANSGLPCDSVISSIEGDEGSTWVETACGLVRIARADVDAWIAAVDQGKDAPSVRMSVLDNSDGVQSATIPGGSFTPHLALARDGKLWFAALDGVTLVGPRHMAANPLPPPVHIEQFVADRKAYAPSGNLTLPPLVRDLTIDYTALSLIAPEKIQFRYKLEGRDRDWEDAGNRRQAFYTDLAPGQYRFRVIASNNSGVWNEQGATLAFAIAPAYWQTNWFLALCAAAFAVVLWGIYKFRTRQLARAAARDREIEQRHRQMEIELAHANRLATMGQLTASIAHEVNQPLGATITNSQAALRWLAAPSPDLDEVRQALEQTVRAGNRAADVVANVRRLAKKTPAPEQDIAVNNEIAEIVAITRGEATKHGVWMRCDLAPDLPIIKADRVELQQVMLNLIVNAIQAMSTLSEGPRELLIRTEADGGGGVIVSVSDTGPGLDAAAMERIFQPFYTSKESGLGMGLSICRSIIESHGGKLWASANTPRGAIFQFTLPPTRPQ